MTSRRHRFLAGLPVIALAPLLAAPRGCHFGDGDVPLGQNATGGDAGTSSGGTSTIGGTSGTGGSTPAVGGTSSGGTSTIGGTSSVGGTSTIGGTSSGGTSTIGGTAGTGGTTPGGGPAPKGACIETLSPIDWRNPGDRDLDVTSSAVSGLFALDHQAELTWLDGARADATLILVGVTHYFVESVVNPNFELDIPVTCENHVRVIATGRLTSSDGRLDETIPQMEWNMAKLEAPDVFAGGYIASSATTIEREQLRGSYAPAISANECFLSIQLNATLGPHGFLGSILKSTGSVPCGVNDPESAVTGGDAAVLTYKDPYLTWPPSVSVVVEAASCDGIGEQVTQTGDEATFTRSGDTISRTESRGCGCEYYPDFVMAWSPSSPVELRLCLHNSENVCLAECVGKISYDLSTAFEAAGSNEFRFVD